jgi:hypothetical protein
MRNLRVADESEIPVPDYDQPALFGWKEFYDFRNHVVQVLRRFGSAGPCGLADLADTEEEAPTFEKESVKNPDFFVVDDMWNEHDRLSLVESDPKYINAKVIEALAEMASGFPGWRVVLRLGDCGLVVFGDKVIAGGRRFWDCSAVEDLARRCAMPLDYGPAGISQETMYPLWLAVICGEFTSSAVFPSPPNREWLEAIRALDEMARRNPGAPLTSFSYARIRYDLHPQTRLQLVQHFLDRISSYPHTSVENARSNILHDASGAFLSAQGVGERESLARSVSAAQNAVASWQKPNDTVFWWPYVLSRLGEPEEAMRFILFGELRPLLNDPNSWIQLSAVFALALLRAEDIAAVVDRAVEVNPNWFNNVDLWKWLQDLRRGSTSYPSLELG